MTDSAMSTTNPVRSLEAVRKIRYRRRRVRTLDGLMRLAFCGFVAIWALFLIDWTLDLPVAVRVFPFAAAAAMAFLALRVFILTARRPVTDAWLAARIEEARPELGQSLLTAIELGGDNPRRKLYSRSLLERSIQEAETRVGEIDPAALVSTRPLLTSAALVVVMFVISSAAIAARTDLAGTFFARDFLFQDTAWPRTYWVEIDEPTERRTVVALGDAFSVRARQLRGGSARAQIRMTLEDGREEVFPLERRGGGDDEPQYRYVIANVTRPFSFRLEVGDYRSETYSVEVRNRPRIAQIQLAYDYPDYTGLDEIGTDDGPLALDVGGHVKAPVGTAIDFTATTTIPVSEVTRIFEYRVGDESETEETELEIEGGTELRGSFVAERPGSYWFRLVSEDGFVNPDPIRYRVAVIPDEAPVLAFEEPGRDIEVGPRVRLVGRVRARDDYGLVAGRVTLQVENFDTDNPIEPVAILEISAFAESPREAEFEIPIDIEPYSIEPGTRLEYYAEAEDARNQVGTSRAFVFTVVSEEELLRIFDGELSLIAEGLEQIIAVIAEAKREISVAEDDPRVEIALPALRIARLNQERVVDRLDEAVLRLDELVQRVADNRVSWDETDRTRSIRRRLDGISKGSATQALQKIENVIDGVADGASVDRETTRDAYDRIRETERALDRLLEELRDWGDLNTVIERLEEALQQQRTLEQTVKDKIQDPRGSEPR